MRSGEGRVRSGCAGFVQSAQHIGAERLRRGKPVPLCKLDAELFEPIQVRGVFQPLHDEDKAKSLQLALQLPSANAGLVHAVKQGCWNFHKAEIIVAKARIVDVEVGDVVEREAKAEPAQRIEVFETVRREGQQRLFCKLEK